jgi:uncharacterized membrane protein YhdT
MTILALLLPVIAACWLGWVGWHSSGTKRVQFVWWPARLSFLAASLVMPAVVATVGMGMGARGVEGVPAWLELAVYLLVMTWLVFGLVALVLADSWKTTFQIVGWGVLSAVLGPLIRTPIKKRRMGHQKTLCHH